MNLLQRTLLSFWSKIKINPILSELRRQATASQVER
jgi:hypothetical protein